MKPIAKVIIILTVFIFVLSGTYWYIITYDGFCDIYFDVRVKGELSEDLVQNLQKSFIEHESGLFRIAPDQNYCDVKVIMIALDETEIYKFDMIASRGYCILTSGNNRFLTTAPFALFQNQSPLTEDERYQNSARYIQTISHLYTSLASKMSYK